jgi:PEGA domain/Tetratricopeptide repeat
MARSISARFPKVLAVVVAGALASTALGPAAMAQGKAGKPAAGAAKGPDKKTRDAARKAYGDGEKAYGAGKYDEAIEDFKKADELIPSPHAQYWIAMALDKQGKSEAAAAAFEKLLASPDASKIGDDKMSEAKARLADLKGKQVGEVNITTVPPGATVSVDGKVQPGESPMILKLPPGSHTVNLSNGGYESQEVKIDVSAGQRTDKNVELKETAPPPAPIPEAQPEAQPEAAPGTPAEPAKPRSKVPAYVTLGIAGVSAGVGTFFGIKALGAKSDFNGNPTSDNADNVERNALIADMAFGVAITLGVTGIVLLTSGGDEPAAKDGALHHKKTAKQVHWDVAPWATPKGGGAAAKLTF